MEELYFGANARSAFAVGQARGVVLLAAGQRGIPCWSYTPQQIKGAVCGSGRAAKDQVQRMVQTLLALDELPRPDHAADALAVAICHANSAPMRRALAHRTTVAAAGAARREGGPLVIALLTGEVAVRRPDHVVGLLRRRRLPARGLGRDAAPGPRRGQAGDAPHAPDRARRRAAALRLRHRGRA